MEGHSKGPMTKHAKIEAVNSKTSQRPVKRDSQFTVIGM